MDTPIEEYSVNVWAIVLFVILFLLIVGIIIWYFLDAGTVNNSVPLGGTCIENNCLIGLVCENSTCKEPIGAPCDHISDCVSSTTACYNGTCTNSPLAGIGGSPPCKAGLINDNGICKVKNDGICNKDCDCSSGNQCYNGKCRKKKIYTSSSNSSYRYTSRHNSDTSSSVEPIKKHKKTNSESIDQTREVSPGNSIYNSQSDSLGNIYQKIRSKNKYNIDL